MKVVWLPAAVESLLDQVAWIEQHNAVAAADIGELVVSAVQRLEDHPGMGRAGRVPGTRELAVAGSPYVVVHRLAPDHVLVLRVLHGAQQWPPA